ncbi:hypothetical protein BST61_g4556 [Cercospora zeina]
MAHGNDESVSSLKALPKLRTATADLMSPTRSRTDPPDERSHLHRRLHSSSLRNRAFTGGEKEKHGYRHAAKETVQSAMDLRPPISFDTLLRRDKKGAESGRHAGSKHSHQHRTSQQQRDLDEWTRQQAQLAPKRQIRPVDIENAKRENEKRENVLRDDLAAVEDVAMNSTRQLDDTYYAILEKVSLLRNTVSGLQQLAEDSRSMHAKFKQDSDQLEQNTKTTFDSFAEFEPQQETINELVDQLKKSKQRTDRLNERLEAARHRMEAYEAREKQNRRTSRQRWSAIWVGLAGLLVLFIGFLLAKHRGTASSNPLIAVVKPRANLDRDPVLDKLFENFNPESHPQIRDVCATYTERSNSNLLLPSPSKLAVADNRTSIMRPFTRVQPTWNAVQRSVVFQRPLSYSPQLRLKEDKPQSPQEIENAKQQQDDPKKREELESSSETVVKAEHNGKGPEELQKETAQQAQKEHPKAK